MPSTKMYLPFINRYHAERLSDARFVNIFINSNSLKLIKHMKNSLKKTAAMSALLLLSFGSIQAEKTVENNAVMGGVSSSCSGGTCTVTTQCSGTQTYSGTSAAVSSSSSNGTTTNKVYINGQLVLEETCESSGSGGFPFPSLCERFPFFCD